MKVRELIEQLKDLPQEMEVSAWDEDEAKYSPIVEIYLVSSFNRVDLLTFYPRVIER